MNKQKIGLFFSDGLAGHETLNKLFPDILELGYEVVLFPTGKCTNERGKIPELASPNFYETTLFHNVVMPFLDKSAPLLNSDSTPIKGLQYSLKQLTQLYNLECYPVSDINAPEFLDYLVNDDCIIGAVSIRNYKIFKKTIINLFEDRGFIWNVHTGILPKYKGRYAPYWAIADNQSEYGWTLHKVDETIDTGDILSISKKPLNVNTTVLNTYLSMSQNGANMIIDGLKYYRGHGSFDGKKQTAEEKLSYYTFPTAKEINKWESNGIRFVDLGKVPDLYTSRFSVAGSEHSLALKNEIIQAIAKYERPRTTTKQLDLLTKTS